MDVQAVPASWSEAIERGGIAHYSCWCHHQLYLVTWSTPN